MLIFSVLAAVCAVLFGLSLHFSLGSGEEASRSALGSAVQNFGWLIPVFVCGAVQYWSLKRSGATGASLWLGVAGTAIGAPVAGIVLMLIVTFTLFSKLRS